MSNEELSSFIDDTGMAAFGMTRTAALENKVCIQCHKSVLNADGSGLNTDLFHSQAGASEYEISGMCEQCFDALFAE